MHEEKRHPTIFRPKRGGALLGLRVKSTQKCAEFCSYGTSLPQHFFLSFDLGEMLCGFLFDSCTPHVTRIVFVFARCGLFIAHGKMPVQQEFSVPHP